MSIVQIDSLADAINQELSLYSASVTKKTKSNVDKVSKEVDEEIKKHITFKQPTGKYVKAFRINNSYEGPFTKRKTWHVKSPYYRLTHLLEKGHALAGGGRTKAYPHIKYGEDLAKKRMEQLTKEAVQGD
ncbi:hypothetical protein FDE76_14765 [Clostridium botulinum]|uniref:HK97 gp10 family phage protein n=1 Tax=Clostridium botulinum (strain Eklund 17B / Type B) TaxID=935198 RepID=B2TQU7_CLOBB|nr:hypothetical protein [Clostridium botulinum]ACD23435.1 conserved hypothetical protein [Clostridium botulinum B str. Eklund 17B (NRP)]MBY6975774.1 hypothetical protein [Clostridium botulinum]MBY7000197.1 hypothetical protein [Clostridium botulinum]MCR1272955.1 hypothetical protein [Clostridium botulinum]NFD71473.1 hypothetical protein [Clostridium botulinum]